MSSLEEKVIELSKTKLLLLILGSIAFIGIGIWMVSLDAAHIESQRRFNNPLFVHAIGYISILFFGLSGIIGLKKLFDKKPGLILNNIGITDNSSAFSAGFIAWSEITGFDVYQTHNQKMLVVLLKNPEKYIEVGNPIRRTLIKASYKMSGSPVAITSNSLKMSFDDLLKTCNEYFVKYGNAA